MGTFQNVTAYPFQSHAGTFYHKKRREVISHEGCALVSGFNFLINEASELPGSFISSATWSRASVSLCPSTLCPVRMKQRGTALEGGARLESDAALMVDFSATDLWERSVCPFYKALNTWQSAVDQARWQTNRYRHVIQKTWWFVETKGWSGQKTEGDKVKLESQWKSGEWTVFNLDSVENIQRVHELGQKMCFAFYWTLNAACMNCDSSSKAHQH